VNITLRNKTREQRSHTTFSIVHFPLLRDISSSFHMQRRHGRISCSRHLRPDVVPRNRKHVKFLTCRLLLAANVSFTVSMLKYLGNVGLSFNM